MALKIRLRQQGKKNRPFFRLVLTESRSPRDGKYLEALGWYNPFETEAEKMTSIEGERVRHWLSKGAIISDCAALLLKKSCPDVLKEYRERCVAAQAKACAKRRAQKKGKVKEEAKPAAAVKKPAAKKAAPKKAAK
jgi:small subunit ribosomal protein S16